MKKIVEMIEELRPENDFKSSQDFIEDGLLDSFDIISLVAELDSQFQISIDGTDIVPQNFNSTESVEKLLIKYGVKVYEV